MSIVVCGCRKVESRLTSKSHQMCADMPESRHGCDEPCLQCHGARRHGKDTPQSRQRPRRLARHSEIRHVPTYNLHILGPFLVIECDSCSVGRLRPSWAPCSLLLALGSRTAQGNSCLGRLESDMNTSLVGRPRADYQFYRSCLD